MGISAPVCACVSHGNISSGGFSLGLCCLINPLFWRTNRYEMQKVYHGAKGDSQLGTEKGVKKQILTVWRCLRGWQVKRCRRGERHWAVTWGLCQLPNGFGATFRIPLLCC